MAIEFMLLLMVVVTLVLISFKTEVPRARRSANRYFEQTMNAIIGKPNPCGDGLCCRPFEDVETCTIDCMGGNVIDTCGADCGDGYCCSLFEDADTCEADCDGSGIDGCPS